MKLPARPPIPARSRMVVTAAACSSAVVHLRGEVAVVADQALLVGALLDEAVEPVEAGRDRVDLPRVLRQLEQGRRVAGRDA